MIEHLKSLLNDKDKGVTNENCIICDNSQQKKYVMNNIYLTSEIVIINIIRKNDPNYTISFNYPEQFDGKIVINEKLDLPNYQLITVIKKIINNNNFQFVEYFKSFTNNQWYIYYNGNTKLLNNKNNIFDDKYACLLIYSKIN